MHVQEIEKYDGEKLDVGYELQPPDLNEGETISSVVCVVDDATLTLDGVAQFAGSVIYQWVTAGTVDKQYKLTFTVTISNGRILTPEYIVKVVH